ncbi:MAG: imidazolonepropionase [Acidobacteria bacterium]|nr:imidazolonepropionase [Acidobacteriota bacterium]MBU1339539.1 imidazolonepropionase [Acidobacteriota bacterium]MBU1475436.1 imidazolonepropionase [Acidobacteriota bacterium]
MKFADCVITDCRQLLTCRGPIPKRGEDLRETGLLENATIASYRGRIVYIGHRQTFETDYSLAEGGVVLNAEGLTALPGFVDPHNHLPFAGGREQEFALRLQGATYQELAGRGMGIQTSVRETRRAGREELTSLCLSRLDSMLLHGTTTTEAKSGYGLNKEDEIKQLEALKEADLRHPIDIISTFLGAHEIPPEYKTDKETYIRLLIDDIIPEIRRRDLAEFFDVFCEEGVYSVEESRRLIQAAKQHGFKIKIHADEFAPLGGTQLAAEEGATSADHVMAITEEGIQALAESDTAATFLPGVSFFLMQNKKAPARRIIDSGAVVALATDFNPGSSMTESMLFILQLAVYTLGMGIEEAINAATANAAFTLRRHNDVGSLDIGKKMDVILFDEPSYLNLVYHLGVNSVRHVVKDGRIVVRDRNLTY